MAAKEKAVTDGVDADEEYILQLRVLLRDLVRKLWRFHGCCEGTGDRPAGTVASCMARPTWATVSSSARTQSASTCRTSAGFRRAAQLRGFRPRRIPDQSQPASSPKGSPAVGHRDVMGLYRKSRLVASCTSGRVSKLMKRETGPYRT